MSIQRELEEHRKKKQEIVDDMKACITKSRKRKKTKDSSPDQKVYGWRGLQKSFCCILLLFQDDIARFDQILNKFIDHIKAYCQNTLEVK